MGGIGGRVEPPRKAAPARRRSARGRQVNDAGQRRRRRSRIVRPRVRQFVRHAARVSERRRKKGRGKCVGRATSGRRMQVGAVPHRMRRGGIERAGRSLVRSGRANGRLRSSRDATRDASGPTRARNERTSKFRRATRRGSRNRADALIATRRLRRARTRLAAGRSNIARIDR